MASKRLALDTVMHNLSGTYLKTSPLYQSVEKSLHKLAISELYNLNAMILSTKGSGKPILNQKTERK